ncbi:hypothetical protein O3M35_005020 [Rhynocoris fuscipes]|uniref:CRAL-TRIO domain-containing protein n=1 Tax=Rhynocoris fuscipes TaxID=488301 RepID=A0AAW1DJ44_9HEMI
MSVITKAQLEELLLQEDQQLLFESDEKVLKEINYSRQQLELDLEQLKQWLKDQHHLPECRLTEKDNFLKTYLTGCKGSLETVKRKLDAYYTLRGKIEVYSNRDPMDENYRKTSEICLINILPKPTKQGSMVLSFRLAREEISQNYFLNIMKRIINVIEIGMRLQSINKPSVVILDYERHSSGHASTFNPSIFKDTLHILQNIFPIRVNKVFLINVPSFFERIINTIVKPTLKKKIRDRLIVTKEGSETLHKYIDKEVLPKDWEGNFPLMLKDINDAWNEYEIRHCNWFINELSEETNESKRVNTDVNNLGKDEYFGVQGSLKKLIID